MVRKLLEFKTENDNVILVAVEAPEAAVAPVAKTGEVVVEKVGESFDTVKDLIINSSRPLIQAFQTLHKEGQAESAEAEFGINFTLSGNVYLVETSGEATFKVKVTWNLHNTFDQEGSRDELGTNLEQS